MAQPGGPCAVRISITPGDAVPSLSTPKNFILTRQTQHFHAFVFCTAMIDPSVPVDEENAGGIARIETQLRR